MLSNGYEFVIYICIYVFTQNKVYLCYACLCLCSYISYINTQIQAIFYLITFLYWSSTIPEPDLSGQEFFEDLKMTNMRELIRKIDSGCGCQSSLLIAVVIITHHPSRSYRAIMAMATWSELGPFSATTSHDDVPMVFNSVIGSTWEKSSDHRPSIPMDPMRR